MGVLVHALYYEIEWICKKNKMEFTLFIKKEDEIRLWVAWFNLVGKHGEQGSL